MPASPLPPETDHVLVAVNPQAGRGSAARRVERLAELLGARGFPVEIFIDLGEVAAQANRLHARGKLRALVGVGGDGTAAELANRTDEGVPITLLPAGTSNLLARQLGLSAEPNRLSRAIAEGNLLRLDAGTDSAGRSPRATCCGWMPGGRAGGSSW
jgi:diacylglycerol kinase family enzyme